MKLHPTARGNIILGSIINGEHCYALRKQQKYLGIPALNYFSKTKTSTRDANGNQIKIKDSVACPFKTKSWQSRMWKKYFKKNPIPENPVFYCTGDGREIECAAIKYFSNRHVYDYETGDKVNREKVMNVEGCYRGQDISRAVYRMLVDAENLANQIDQDTQIADYVTIFRVIVRYTDGKYDCSPTNPAEALRLLGLRPVVDENNNLRGIEIDREGGFSQNAE